MSCYRRISNEIQYTSGVRGDVPCGDGNSTTPIQCCWHGDYCMSDNLCHYTHSVFRGSGYYTASCTDPEGKDPACTPHCTDVAFPDVVWNSTAAQWYCCAEDSIGPNCQMLSNESFSAPPPDQLKTTYTLPSTATGAAAVASPTFSTPSLITSASSPVLSGSWSVPSPLATTAAGLDLGASAAPSSSATSTPAAGNVPFGSNVAIISAVGIGSALGGNLIIALLVWFFIRWRRRRLGRAPSQPQGAPLELPSDRKSAPPPGPLKSPRGGVNRRDPTAAAEFFKESGGDLRAHEAEDTAKFELKSTERYQLEDTSWGNPRYTMRSELPETRRSRPLAPSPAFKRSVKDIEALAELHD